MEVIVRTQDGKAYKEFALPLEVYLYLGDRYVVSMNNDIIGEYKEEKHAIHVMNYLLAHRNHYMFDNVKDLSSIIISVPSDELVRQTPDENLIDSVPVKEKEEKDKTNNGGNE